MKATTVAMDSSTIAMSYGRRSLPLILPESAIPTIIRKKQIEGPSDPMAAIEAALSNPIGAAHLSQAAAAASSACILVCDITRPVPNHLFLRPLIERLVAGGIAISEITILVATGLHRPNLGEELAELIGDQWVLENVAIENHDARDDAAHIMFEPTPTRGTPVGLDRRFVEAELKIVTGLVEPHFMAGYSGGRKVIAPGISHHSTIRTFHSARFMEDPATTACNLTSNPLHEEQLQILGLLDSQVYGLNTVLDEERNLVHVNFGDILCAHDEAVAFVREAALVSVGERFSTVVTSSAGYPLDATYYQTVKSMVTALDILMPGGTLIVISECSEGLGSPEFRAAQERLLRLGAEKFLASIISKQQADVDEWQTEMLLRALRSGRVQLFAPDLCAADHLVTGVDTITDMTEAVRASINKHNDHRVAVIPEGPYVIPKVAAASSSRTHHTAMMAGRKSRDDTRKANR